MAQPNIPDCCDAEKYTPTQLFYFLFCLVASINEAVGGDTGSSEYTSVFSLATADGTIPVGALGWSISAVSGTVTVQGSALAVGQSVKGGGYGSKTLKTAIPYTITGGSALVIYDAPG